MSRLFQLRLVGAVLASLIVGMGTAAQGQHDLAAGLSPDGQLPHNPFRQAGFQQSEGYDSPTSLEGIDRQLDSAFKPVESIGVDITSSLAGERPEQKSLASREGMSETMVLVRPWPTLSYYWVAPATRHNPLYFEEVNAERYGYTCSPCLQPAISTAHFFGTLPALPYLVGANCCCECQYTLGHYRPGSCNPWRPHFWPVSARGALCQAGVVTGVAFLP